MNTPCSEPGCPRPARAKGLCHTHYMRTHRHPTRTNIPAGAWTERTSKGCSRCHELLPLSAFRLDAAGRPRSRCIDCQRIETRESAARQYARRRELYSERYRVARNAGADPVEAAAARFVKAPGE
jgi:hypothetical protein